MSLYSAQTYLRSKEYYNYRFSPSNSDNYTIIYYEGSYSFGSLYVTSDCNDSLPTIEMISVSRKSEKSLPTSITEDKYFYLTNSDYSSYPYIYILLEDNNFGLSYSNVKYCQTNRNPGNNTANALASCIFNSLSYYSNQSSSYPYKYYYQISIRGSYPFNYTIIYYNGSSSSGNLYVTTDYYDLTIIIKMTQVFRNSETPLSTFTSEDKYFYLTIYDYPHSYYSSYIYICLEDFSFNLDYYKVNYCRTDTDPGSYPNEAIKHCSFHSLNYYDTKSYSSSTKYYFKLELFTIYSYVIISYDGRDSSGSLYVTSDNNDFLKSKKDPEEQQNIAVIVLAVLGSLIFFAFLIFLICYFTRCRQRKKDNNIIQPNYIFPSPAPQSNYVPPSLPQNGSYAAPPVSYPSNIPVYNPDAPTHQQTDSTPIEYKPY